MRPSPCLDPTAEFGPGFEYIGGSQSPYRAFADTGGVGRRFQGGQRIVFDCHYFNTTEDEIRARSAVNFHFSPEAQVEHLAQTFGFLNITIDTPPGADLHVTWVRGGVDHAFDEPVLVKAGEGFRYRCDYENTESYPLRYGQNATDEMCSLIGLWYSETSNDPPSQDCVLAQSEDDGIARRRTDVTFPSRPRQTLRSAWPGPSKTSRRGLPLAPSARAAAARSSSTSAPATSTAGPSSTAWRPLGERVECLSALSEYCSLEVRLVRRVHFSGAGLLAGRWPAELRAHRSGGVSWTRGASSR